LERLNTQRLKRLGHFSCRLQTKIQTLFSYSFPHPHK
jgi:hypothetical protein